MPPNRIAAHAMSSDRPRHTLEDFELELQSLRGSVLTMSRIALDMVDPLGALLEDNRKPDAAEAKRREKELDQLEAEVDRQAQIILMRYQPVATDLRDVTGAVRMATDFEQIGDDARRIAEKADQLEAWISYDADGVLQELWERSERALADAHRAYAEHEIDAIRAADDPKHAIRKLANSARARISDSVVKNQSLAPSFVEAVNATHALEDIGMHACSLGEAIIFIETAARRREQRKKP